MQGRRGNYKNASSINYRSRNGSNVAYKGKGYTSEHRRNHYDSTNKRRYGNYSVEESEEQGYESKSKGKEREKERDKERERNRERERDRNRNFSFGYKNKSYNSRNQLGKSETKKKVYSFVEAEDLYQRNRRKFVRKSVPLFKKQLSARKPHVNRESSRRKTRRSYETPVKGRKKEETIKTSLTNIMGKIYPTILQNFKKNRRYAQRVMNNKNYKIVIYLVRHAEALHNEGVNDNPTVPRYEIYKNEKYLDCKLSEGGYEMCKNSPFKQEVYYQEIQTLYKKSQTKEKQTNKHSTRRGNANQNENFMVVCSPLKRCLETLYHYLNIKKNILIYEPVRETAGAYCSDERSSTTEVKKFCDEKFDNYETLCFGENDLIPGTVGRETRTQVESRCLQFLKLAHSYAMNYFTGLEKKKEEANRKHKTSEHSSKDKEDVSTENRNNKAHSNTSIIESSESSIENDKNTFYIILVSHSSYIAHLLALLDFFELNERVLKNCEIKKISLPLNNMSLFHTDSTKLQMVKPTLTNTLPLVCGGGNQKLLKRMYKDRHIFNIHTLEELKRLECLQCCTVIIFKHDKVIQHEKNLKILDLIKHTIEKCNQSNNQQVFSHGIYKKHVMQNPELGRKLLITDGSAFLKYSEEHNLWEIKKKGYFLRQNVVIILLPYVDAYCKKYRPLSSFNLLRNSVTDKEGTTVGKHKEKEQTKDEEKERENSSLENVKEVINLYSNINDLINSKEFWTVIKDNIKQIDLFELQEFLVNKFNTLINNEEGHVCYLNLVECLKNENFMKEYQNKCNGYLKNLKEKYDKKVYIDFEKECRYINEYLLPTMFCEQLVSSEKNKEKQEKEMNHSIDTQHIVKRKFIYIPQKSEENNVTNSSIGKMKGTEFLSSGVKLLRTLPTSIQNLNVELFHQDSYWFIHCLHKYVKSKNKKEGIVFAKLLCCLDLMKSNSVTMNDSLFRKLLDVEKRIHNNEYASSKDKVSIFVCENKCVESCNTPYCSEGIRKYKKIHSLPGKSHSVVEELNHLRQNILTVSGGAEHVFILNII